MVIAGSSLKSPSANQNHASDAMANEVAGPAAVVQPWRSLASIRTTPFTSVGEFQRFLTSVNPNTVHDLRSNCSRESRCKVAVCTALYLEDPYLLEWVLYNLLLGIDHLFLVHMTTLHNVSHRSVEASERILQPFMDRGLVTTTRFPVVYDAPQLMEQVAAMRFCFNRFKGVAEWLLNLDVDEFYFSARYPTFPCLVAAAERNATGAVALPWVMFGSSGYEKRPDFPHRLTIEVYHRRAAICIHDSFNTTFFGRLNGKFLVSSRCFRTLPSPHQLTVFAGCNVTRPALNDSTFHLKHFHSKSLQDWMWKRHATGYTGFRTREKRDEVHCTGDTCGFWNSYTRNFLMEWRRSDAFMNETSDFDLLGYAPMLHALMAVSDLRPHHRWCRDEAKKRWGPLSCF
eukprot:GGOE01014994.1.p1 GENE.GGOE01014994.1~~GGOE01014994.1.p1  ORF type:complete len:400 (-),score=110.70 GGOE01014994.1:163-1362(-)